MIAENTVSIASSAKRDSSLVQSASVAEKAHSASTDVAGIADNDLGCKYQQVNDHITMQMGWASDWPQNPGVMVTHPRGKNPGLAVQGPGVPGVASLDPIRGWHGKIFCTISIILFPSPPYYRSPHPYLIPTILSPSASPPVCLYSVIISVPFPSVLTSFGFAYYFSAFSILYAVFVLRRGSCNKNICSTEWS